jgi:hypothetical protein
MSIARTRICGLKVAESLKTYLLLRKDDVASALDKRDFDACFFLQKLVEGIGRKSFPNNKINFEKSFFVLGRSSLAIIACGTTLQDVPDLITAVNDEHEKLLSGVAQSQTGSFECFAFPAVPVLINARKSVPRPEATIPTMFFVRTPVHVNAIIRSIRSNLSITSHLEEISLGLGVYDIIFWLEFEDLYELRDTLTQLRKSIGVLWETSTLIGIPDQPCLDRKRAETDMRDPLLFSISIRCYRNVVSKAILSEIKNLIKRASYLNMFKDINNQDILTHRQGYMDLEIFCRSKCLSDVFDLVCNLRKIEGIVDSSTVAQIRVD